MGTSAHTIITDLTIHNSSAFSPPTCNAGRHTWHRIPKNLYLDIPEQSAWVYVALAIQDELVAGCSWIVGISIGEPPPHVDPDRPWESRPCGIWISRSNIPSQIEQAVTGIDVLFGADVVDPRPQWTLLQAPLHLEAPAGLPAARLTILNGRPKPRLNDGPTLRVRENGTFKIVQIADTHMVTGVGVCKDAIDGQGNHLPESEADPLTMKLIGTILDVESPDLVILTGDQLHHGIADSQSALFKVTAPIIERSIPFAAVFGNHDTEGQHALSRVAQMSILQDLPFSLCKPGPECIDGIGNFCLEILAPAPSQLSLSTLYLLDSHGQVPSKVINPDYEPIKQSQIDWFISTSQAKRKVREANGHSDRCHLSLVFFHIPLPEFGNDNLDIYSGHRREPTESSSINTHFYDALVKEGVSALGCGHDHVNDFCALLPCQNDDSSNDSSQLGPWLCYGGGTGFGGYCSYGKDRFHRRARVWELDTNTGSLATWMRVEYAIDRVGELTLVDRGAVSRTQR